MGYIINLTILLQVTSLEKLYGAQLVWKIEGYEEKMKESKAGQKPTIFSPPFLTGRHGYKLAMSASLYGDGKGIVTVERDTWSTGHYSIYTPRPVSDTHTPRLHRHR